MFGNKIKKDIIKTEKSHELYSWHKEILDRREEGIANGSDEFEDWDDVKSEILKITENSRLT